MTNEELERLEALARAVADDSGKKLFFSHAQFRNAANPQAILSLIQRVKEAESRAAIAEGSATVALSRVEKAFANGHAAGRAEALEEAAKVARSFDKSLMSMTREDVQACEIEAAIRALGEKAGG